MVFFGILGFTNGDPQMIMYPYDSGGNQCGREGTATEEYTYIYFLNPSDRGAPTVCLKECPSDSTNSA